MSTKTAFKTRVRAVREVLRIPVPRTMQEWLDELLRQPNPEAELVIWETVAFAYTAFFEARTPTAKAKDQAVRVLLDCSTGASEKQIHKHAYKSLSIAEIRSLIEHYWAADETAREIAQLRRHW